MTATPPPAQKFLFNRSFDSQAEPAKAREAAPPPAYSQSDLDAAVAAARAAGQAEGEQSAQQTQQAQLIALAGQIEKQIGKLLDQSAARQTGQQADIADIALAVARKIVPEAVADHALAGIAAMVAQVCREMAREPRLVVRVHDSLLDPLKHQLDALTAREAYNGKVVLLADDALLPGDCKIEWADGGIERDTAVIWQQIDQAVNRAKSLAGAPAAPPASSSPQE